MLPVKGNKKCAEQMLIQARQEMEQEFEYRMQAIKSGMSVLPDKLTFTQFLADWLKMMKTSVETTTFAGYSQTVNNKIIPYFDKRFPKLLLRDVTPKHIQDYYTYEKTENRVSANTVIHRNANIRKAMQYAFKTGLIDSNPADKVQRPKEKPHPCEPYNAAELEKLFKAVKGTKFELGVILVAFYGLRRGEAVGLKWSAIDFERKTITISHTVVETMVDGKRTLLEKDRPKTKSSNRTLPLVKPFEKLLMELKKKQAENRRLCGACYCREYMDYI